MRNSTPLAARLVLFCSAAAAIGCSDPAPAGSTSADATGTTDTAATFDGSGGQDTAAGKDTTPDAVGTDAAAIDAVDADSSGTDATTGDAAAVDTAVVDATANDTAATDGGASDATTTDSTTTDSTTTDTATTDTAIVDATASDTAKTDTAATDTGPADVAAADTAPVDASSQDSGPGECKAGALKRCWVECPEVYPSGCINAGLPVLIMGVQSCAAGAWQPCATNLVCSDLKGTCTNGTKKPATVQCTDGSSKNAGGYLCLKPIGAQCNTSYYGSWPMSDCPDLCAGPDDTCSSAGEKRECTTTCGSTTGPAVKGTQNCNDYCNGKFWGPCLTDDACLKLKN